MPRRRFGMLGLIEVHGFSPPMTKHDKAVQNPECRVGTANKSIAAMS